MNTTTDDLTLRARDLLTKGGMSRRDALSTLDGITPEIRAKLPAGTLEAVAAGKTPPGFGLGGPVGAGKTGTLAALVLALVESGLRRGKIQTGRYDLLGGGTEAYDLPVAWANWPETVNTLRVLSTSDDGMEAAAGIIARLSDAWILVLDDLGAERVKAYAEDWATTQLDLVLDRRYNDLSPVWYTTSLGLEPLIARYGRRMVERLMAENPLILLPKLGSRRLA